MASFKGLGLAAFLAGACFCGACHAESVTVYLKNGSEIAGALLEDSASLLVLKTVSGKTRSFNKKTEIDYVVKNAPPEKKPDAPPAATATTEVKPDPKAAPKNEAGSAPKTGDKAAEATAPKDPKTGDKTAKTDPKKIAVVPGLASFPKNGKRMSADKEAVFMAALAGLASGNDATRTASKAQIAGMGEEILPYLVAGIQHNNVEARSDCMALIPGTGTKSRGATKAVIEVFYRAMPEVGQQTPTWQKPFIRAIKETLPALTGQTYITVNEDRPGVQDGLQKYIEWYDANATTLPEQLGDEDLDPTDPDYAAKLKKARELKKVKNQFAAPPTTAELARGTNKNNDRPDLPAGAGERPEDKAFRDKIPTVKRNDAFKRDVDR
jgi:hypothetical protein